MVRLGVGEPPLCPISYLFLHRTIPLSTFQAGSGNQTQSKLVSSKQRWNVTGTYRLPYLPHNWNIVQTDIALHILPSTTLYPPE